MKTFMYPNNLVLSGVNYCGVLNHEEKYPYLIFNNANAST
jgi:hypothetical protein